MSIDYKKKEGASLVNKLNNSMCKSLFMEQQEAGLAGVLVVSPKGEILSYNSRFIELWGVSPTLLSSGSDEIVLHSVIDKVDKPAEFLERIKYLYENPEKKSFEEINLIDQRTFERYSAPVVGDLNEILGRVWYFHDITERKMAEQQKVIDSSARFSALGEHKRQESEFRALLNLIPSLIWIKDTKNRILHVNQNVAESIGKSIGEIEGKESEEIYPESAAKYYRDDLEVIRSGQPKVKIIETLRDSNGNDTWVETTKVPYFSEGKVAGILVMANDITERKRIENSLRDREEEFRILAESMPQIVWMTRADGWNIYFNQKWVEYTGLSLSKKVLDIIGASHFILMTKNVPRLPGKTQQLKIRPTR